MGKKEGRIVKVANQIKKEKQENKEANNLPSLPKKQKKGKGILVFFGILIITGVIGFVFRKQLSSTLGNALKNVPIANKLFKQEDTDPYSNLTKEELISQLETAKNEQDALNQKVLDIEGQNLELEERINTLKQYEAQYTDFLNQKQAWDEKIAKTNPKLFLEQFEKIYPDTMEKIYKDIKIDDMLTKEQKEFCNTVGQMEQDQAAKALETLISTDPELIKLVFEGMEQERKSLILSSMQSQNAATVIKLLSPNVDGTNE
ncbi:MAG: hypothetical protein K0S71_474 [Clostridia bacterium]|jgi:flagellar motility protein MotE (MotC chaperone)|nr:hypothetical protein [Clostridia bacterium]